MKLGENIRRLRIEAGHLNAAQFARDLGVNPARLSDWESGRYNKLRLDNLLRIAKRIPCTVEAMLVGIDEEYDAVLRVMLSDEQEKETSAGNHLLRDRPDSEYKYATRNAGANTDPGTSTAAVVVVDSECAVTPADDDGEARFIAEGSDVVNHLIVRKSRSLTSLAAGIATVGIDMRAEGIRLIARGDYLVATSKRLLHEQVSAISDTQARSRRPRSRIRS